MNKESAQKILTAYGSPRLQNAEGTVIVTFSRQTSSSITEIEKMDNEQLITRYKSLVWMNFIYGQVSLGDLQRIDLMDLEIDERKLDEGLSEWYEKATADFEKAEQQL